MAGEKRREEKNSTIINFPAQIMTMVQVKIALLVEGFGGEKAIKLR